MDRDRIIALVEAEILRQESLAMFMENEVFASIHCEVAEALKTVLEAYKEGD